MFCSKCGNIIPDNAKFCTSCGAPVENRTNVNALCDHPHPGQPLPQISFGEAVRRFFTHYADFSTRARRSEYWWAILFTSLVTSAASIIFGGDAVLTKLITLALFVPGVSLGVRRLHDVGKPGTWYLWNLLPVIGSIIVFIQVLKDSEPDNQWGPNPKYR